MDGFRTFWYLYGQKDILTYNLSFKKCHVSFQPSFGPKHNAFQFYKDEKQTNNFAETDS